MSLELFANIEIKINITKNNFKAFIKHINEKKIKLNNEINIHIKKLIELWNNNKNADIEYYFSMKNHHSYINDKIKNITLDELWNKYIYSCLDLRTELLALNEFYLKNLQLLNKIKHYIPNEKINFKKNKITGNLEIIFINKKAVMTILECNTWDEIKRHIDAKINDEKRNECSICATNELQKKRVTCTKCASEWCINCYISIFRTNKGIIKCPFCRFAYGEEFSEDMIEIGIQEIINKIDMF